MALALILPLLTFPFWFNAKLPPPLSENELSATAAEPDVPLDWQSTQEVLDETGGEIEHLEATMNNDLLPTQEPRDASESR
ncbi:MAG: hypothetical protein U0872_16090 [Planctomycetaceae bacterium]